MRTKSNNWDEEKIVVEEFRKVRDFCLSRKGHCQDCPINLEPKTNSACIFMYLPKKWKLGKLQQALAVIKDVEKKDA